MTVALERFPVLHKAEIRTLLNGPESFTPDNQFILGEAPELRILATSRDASPQKRRNARRSRTN